MRAVRWLAWTGLAILVATVATGLWYRQASQPLHEGTLRLEGLDSTVEVRRDGQGIPTILASNERDATFALGFLHAQDRLWQMEFNRRLAAGRLSELLGPAALPTDKFLRTLGVRRAAQRSYETLDEAHRLLVDAYVDGVNAFLASRSGPLPPEFLLLRAPAPEPWTAADSMAWSLMMAWDLASHGMRMELRRLRLAQRFSRAEIDDIYPPLPGESAPGVGRLCRDVPPARCIRYGAGGKAAAHGPKSRPGSLAAVNRIGSNNWVLSGQRTVSGRPLLANDPHLALTTPPVWYFAAMRLPGLELIGATLPGLPGVVLGRNDRVAWGMTNTGVDQQDLYLERLVGEDEDEYETPTGCSALRKTQGNDSSQWGGRCRTGDTRDAARSGAQRVWSRSTRPSVIGALSLHCAGPRSIRATEPGLPCTRSITLAASQAAERALADFNVVTQSFVLADVDGNIGMVVAGRIPRRRADNDLQGIAPAPGWDERYDWQGYLAYEEAPRRINPPEGFIATANNRIAPPDYPHHLTFDWFPSFRVRRIAELVGAREKHDCGFDRGDPARREVAGCARTSAATRSGPAVDDGGPRCARAPESLGRNDGAGASGTAAVPCVAQGTGLASIRRRFRRSGDRLRR